LNFHEKLFVQSYKYLESTLTKHIEAHENTFLAVVNFHYSLTGRALCLSWITLKVSLSAEGADHKL
jgi:hypothetical protein